jgi:iron complex outermembrane recepter protein
MPLHFTAAMRSLIEGWGVLMRIAAVVISLCLSVVGIASAMDAQAMVREETNIPPQLLDNALRTLAEDRGFHIVYLPAVVNSLRTQGAAGVFTRDEVLTQLLNGTGLAFHYLDEDTVTIVPASSAGTSATEGRDNARSHDRSAKGEQKNSLWERFRLAQADEARTGRNGSAGGADTQEDSDLKALEEVIVTAQKREQRLQDVPISISALTQERLERTGADTFQDYLGQSAGI